MKLQALVNEVDLGEFPVRVVVDEQEDSSLLLNFAPEINLVLTRDTSNGVFLLRVFKDTAPVLNPYEVILYTTAVLNG